MRVLCWVGGDDKATLPLLLGKFTSGLGQHCQRPQMDRMGLDEHSTSLFMDSNSY
jgi:hypothetical protein